MQVSGLRPAGCNSKFTPFVMKSTSLCVRYSVCPYADHNLHYRHNVGDKNLVFPSKIWIHTFGSVRPTNRYKSHHNFCFIVSAHFCFLSAVNIPAVNSAVMLVKLTSLFVVLSSYRFFHTHAPVRA